jgi:hypothetical protein
LSEIANDLSKKLPVLEWYANHHCLKVEPTRYPNGLFTMQKNPKKRFDIHAYIEEIKQDIELLVELSGASQLIVAKRITQKINVLVTSFKLQLMQEKKTSNIEQLMTTLEANEQSAFDYFTKKYQNHHQLRRTIEQQQEQLVALEQVLAQFKTNDTDNTLSIKQQMGLLHKKITHNKEILNDLTKPFIE